MCILSNVVRAYVCVCVQWYTYNGCGQGPVEQAERYGLEERQNVQDAEPVDAYGAAHQVDDVRTVDGQADDEPEEPRPADHEDMFSYTRRRCDRGAVNGCFYFKLSFPKP